MNFGGDKILKDLARKSDDQAGDQPLARQAAKPRKREERILVVEDYPEVLNLAADLLEDSGYYPLKANNGETALAALAEHGDPVVLALIDMVMPGMNGLELYRKITVSLPNLPVIFVTGYDAEEYRELIPLEYPIIQKPYSPSDLLGLVRRLLG